MARLGPEKAEKAAAKTAGDVGKLRNVIAGERVENFAAYVNHQYKDESERYLAPRKVRERSEQYHHKNHAACAKEGGREDQDIEDAGYEGGDGYHRQKRTGTVVFFEDGAEQKDERKVCDKVIPACVADGVGKERDPAPDQTGVETAASGDGEPCGYKAPEDGT